MARKRKEKKKQKLQSGNNDNITAAGPIAGTAAVSQLTGHLEVYLNDGKKHFRVAQYQEALNELSRIPAGNRTANVLSLLAEANFRLALECYRDNLEPGKKYNLILNRLSQAISLQPGVAIYHFHLGLVFEHLDNLKKARAAYRTAIELAPENGRFIFHLVLAYLKSDQVQSALELLQEKQASVLVKLSALLIKLKQGEAITVADINDINFDLPGEKELFDALLKLQTIQPERARILFEIGLEKVKNQGNGKLLNGFLSYFLGLAHLESGRKVDQEKYWEQALVNGVSCKRYAANLVNFCWIKGIQSAESGDLSTGQYWFELVLKLEPGHVAAKKNTETIIFLRANKLAESGDWSGALNLWQSIQSMNDLNVLHNIAIAYDKLEEANRANMHWHRVTGYYEQECRKFPDDPVKKEFLAIAYQHLIKNYHRTGHHVKASQVFQKLVNLKPDNYDLQMELADNYIENEKYGSARKLIDNILRSQPEHTSALASLAFIQEMEGDCDAAIATLDQVLVLEPGHGNAREQLYSLLDEKAHMLLYYLDDYKEAARLYERQIELNPRSFNGYHGMGHIYLRYLNDKNSAKELFNRYLETDSNNPSVYIDVGKAYFSFGSKTTANSYFRQAEKLASEDPELLVTLGKALYDHSASMAESYFRKAIQLDHLNPDLYYKIGSYFLEVYNFALAIKYYHKCLEVDKKYFHAHINLAFIYMVEGKRKNAAEHIRIAKRLVKTASDKEIIQHLEAKQEIFDNQLDLFDDFLDE